LPSVSKSEWPLRPLSVHCKSYPLRGQEAMWIEID
jgi:hypothetical protein